MTQVKVSKVFNLDADTLWSKVLQFNNMDRYLPSMITSCTVEGSGEGAKRVCGTENGVIQETLSKLDNDSMTLEYTIDNDDAPLPLSDYTGYANVENIGGGQVRFSWSGQFEPKGISEEEISTILEGAYAEILDNIAKHSA